MLTSPVQALSLQQWLYAYGATLLALLVLDALWIGLYMAPAYKEALGELMLPQPRFSAAALFYILYAAGVVFLAVAAGLRGGGWHSAALYGAVVGLMAYGTYDITNYSILKAWPLGLSVLDVGWGTLMTALSAVAGCLVAQRWA